MKQITNQTVKDLLHVLPILVKIAEADPKDTKMLNIGRLAQRSIKKLKK